jgi:hypothetical protein
VSVAQGAAGVKHFYYNRNVRNAAMNFFRTIDPRLPYILPVLAIVLSLPLPIYSRDWHKLLHIGGAVLFMGNILVTAAWMVLAENTKKPAIVHFAAKSVMQADLLFTIPGVLLIFINGLKLASAYGGGAGFVRAFQDCVGCFSGSIPVAVD